MRSFLKKEERLNLCVPGGKETARMLKQLREEIGSKAPAAAAVATDAGRATAPCGRRARHARATIRPRRNSCRAAASTSAGSAKDTWHVEFDLSASGLDYVVGDSFGVFPDERSGAGRSDDRRARRRSQTTDVGGKTLREVLIARTFRWRRRRTSCSSCSPT